MLSYGGIELLQPDTETLARLEQGTVLHELWQFPPVPLGQAQSPLYGLLPHFGDRFRARLGVLYWPQGASRFAFGRFLVGDRQRDEIRALAYSGGSGSGGGDGDGDGFRPLEFVIDDGRKSVTTELWMLPPTPLEQCLADAGRSVLPGAHLLTLVDERYHWWMRGGGRLAHVLEGRTSWDSLFLEIALQLGITVRLDEDADGDYGTPAAAYALGADSSLPPLLDAVAESCGMKIVRDLDGTVYALTLGASRARLARNLRGADPSSPPVRLSGGRLSFERGRADAEAALPELVRVCFPRREPGPGRGGGWLSATERAVDVRLADLVEEYGHLGTQGIPETLHVILRPERAGVVADDAESAHLETLARRLAVDWYGHQLGPLDECFEGVLADWEMEGLTRLVEYEHLPGQIRTRARRGPWEAAGPSRHGPGPSIIPALGTFYLGGEVTYGGSSNVYYVDDTDVTYQGGGCVLLEGGPWLTCEDGRVLLTQARIDVTCRTTLLDVRDSSLVLFADDTAVYFDGGLVILLEDGSRLELEEGDTYLVGGGTMTVEYYQAEVNYVGGSVLTVQGFVLCGLWWLCYETLPPVTTEQTELTISTDKPISEIPFTTLEDLPVRGIEPPLDTTLRQRHRIINVGTVTTRYTHQDPLAPSDQSRIIIPGEQDLRQPPGFPLEIEWDVTEQQWRVVERPGVVPTGVPDGQTIYGGTLPGDGVVLIPSTDADPGTIDVLVPTADTTSVREVFRIRHGTTGTAGTGFGVQQSFLLEDASGNEDVAGSLDVRWTDATHTSEDADLQIRLQRGGTLTDQVRLTGSGGVRFPEVSEPATPAAGTVLVFAADNVLKIKDEAGTVTELGGSSLPPTPPSVVSLTAVPTWFLVNTLDHTDLTDADTNQTVDAYVLPAKSFLHAWTLRTKTVGSGGGVTVLTLVAHLDGSGLAAQSTDGMIADNAVGSRVIDQTQGEPIRWATTAMFQVQFAADVNLDTLSGGEWEVSLLLSTLG